MSCLTADQLRKILRYDPDTGHFTWLIGPSYRVKPGDRAGYQNQRGYWRIVYKKRDYLLHRLAWLYVHGYYPPDYIDHINGDPSDNRLVNLRLATNAQNQANRKRKHNCRSQTKGVSLSRGRWRACITVDKRYISLGTYSNLDDAAQAYAVAALKYFGEYGRADK